MSTTVREAYEVGDLNPTGVLEAAAEAERAERRAAFRKLELAAHWADLHPASQDTGVETFGGPVLLADESLGGDGTPAVAAFTPEPFALAMGMSPAAGAQLIADALDLRHRLPLLWRRLGRLEVPAWQARRVARQTHRLPLAGARWVDEQLVDRSSCGPVVVERLVAHAIATCEPETHEDREHDARADWDVTLTHPDATDFLGTSHLDATGDTLVLKAFHDQVCGIAHQLLLDGDTSPLGVRKIKALGILTGQPTGTSNPQVKVYARVDAHDLEPDALAAGQLEKLGAATLTRIREWVGHHQVVIQPVLNLARRDAVDSHDPPGWMRELVQLRDGHCIFPRCQTDARSCDLDHSIPYDPNGPPGQTRPANLACLCRRHHRAKTTGHWRYLRTPDGGYQWHGPHSSTYLVTAQGTSRLGSTLSR
ncbi:MAG TPA: HNH endonuclease signature motif containing protein [Nocardioides sp.]|nr:HNH endonuclease signature motif containing protein [Nocardioides sp.]